MSGSEKPGRQQLIMKRMLTLLSNLFIGIPGGFLIFMSMLMFNALLGLSGVAGSWLMLILLSFTSLIVGLLVRMVRPINGLGAAIASGVVAAGIILYLWMCSAPGTDSVTQVFAPAGMLATLAFSTLGGWLLPHLWKHSK
jgi:hypothetical protein